MIRKLKWITVSSKKVLKNKWFSLLHDKVKLPGGKIIDYFYMDYPGSIVIVPITNDNEVLMIEQYRYPVKKTCLEVPAGSQEGEEPDVCARRELEEEIGVKSDKITYLGSFYSSNSFSNENVKVFLAEKLKYVKHKRDETEKSIKVKKRPFKKVVEDIKNGKIVDGLTIIALLFTEKHLSLEDN